MQTGSKQLLLIAGACLLTVILYFAPKISEKKESNDKKGDSFSFESLVTEAKGQLKRFLETRYSQKQYAIRK